MGWKANALRVGDSFVELNRLDPLGLSLGIFATFHEMVDETNGTQEGRFAAATATLLSVSDLLLDRSYLSTVGDMMDAIVSGSSGSKTAARTLVSIGTSFVTPGILRDFREMADPARRSLDFPMTAEGVWQRAMKQITNAVPIGSKGLPNAVDWKGEPIISGANGAVRAFLPVRVGEFKEDLATSALLANNIPVRKPKEFYAFEGTSGKGGFNWLEYDPSGKVYAEYQAYIGQARKQGVLDVVSDGRGGWSDAYKELTAMGQSGTPQSALAKLIRGQMQKREDEAEVQFFEHMKNKSIPSKLVPGENVPAHHGTLSEEQIGKMIMALKLQKGIEITNFPGAKIKKSGGKHITPGFEGPAIEPKGVTF